MAIFLRGLDLTETVTLTNLMTQSGDVLTWPEQWRHLVVVIGIRESEGVNRRGGKS